MAQKLAFCAFCDTMLETTGIQKLEALKCINCDINLCGNCNRKRHSKIKGSKEHCIIRLNQLGTLKAKDSVRKLELANIICLVHKDEKCTAYCISCSKELCTFCAFEGKHQDHKISKLETVYNEQVSELNNLKSKMKDDISFFNAILKNTELKRQEEAEIYEKAKQKIVQREKDMKEIASRESGVLFQKLDILLKPQIDALNKTKETLQKNIDYLKQTVSLTDQILQSNDAKSVFDIAISIKKELPSRDIKELDVTVKSQVDFIAPVLPLRFGSLVMPKLTIKQSVHTPLKSIKCLESFSNGKYVSIVSPTGTDSQSSLEYFQIKGLNFVVECKISLHFKPCDMKVIENNQILFICQDRIFSLSEINKFEIFFLSDMVLSSPNNCICITAVGNILLGCNAGHFGTSDAILLNNQGLIKNRSTLKYHVDKIAASEHDTYIIISQRLSLIKVVQGLSSTFESKWTYEGHSSINSIVKFEPMDIAVSTSGLIYVTDESTHSIHVLTQDGDFVKNYGKEHGIIDPEVLHLDKEGQLIIWCRDGTIHVADISS
ncbi:E3 ubiquitin-protein ligase TRIM71-like [Mytilus edulis]|uniref:E3 ubiquitin-protein ligase TRIM71-like n=1 Tax=Mytilus edulis TaxID=6550 RepID=UPI0039EE9E0F